MIDICAIVYGGEELESRTVSRLLNLPYWHVPSLRAIDFGVIQHRHVFFLKNGDALPDYALHYLALNLSEETDLFYSDEAIFYHGEKKRFHFYKPDFSPDLLLSYFYCGHLLGFKTDLLKTIPGIESQHDDNVLYEMVLKTFRKCRFIQHFDEVLYWRYRSEQKKVDYADFFSDFNEEEGRKALEYYCQENGIKASVEQARYPGTYRLAYVLESAPLVSIIIPFKDKAELLETCINSILAKSTYQHYEIIGIDNGSKEKKTVELMATLQERDKRIKFYTLDIPFNFSRLNNDAVNRFAQGEHLLLLNNDTEVIEPSWIEALLEHSSRPEVGVVGAKLLYPDFTLQHCGIILGPLILHGHRHLPDSQPGYFYFPHVVRNYHALTFACVMIKAPVFKELGGLYEKLAIAYNDVDFCARASIAGYYNVYTPYATLFHYESKSRGLDDLPEKVRFARWEEDIALNRSPVLFWRDSFYNKNLTQRSDDFSEKMREDIVGLFLYLLKRVKARYQEFGLLGFFKLVLNRALSFLRVFSHK